MNEEEEKQPRKLSDLLRLEELNIYDGRVTWRDAKSGAIRYDA